MRYAVSIKDASFSVGRNPPAFDRIVSFDLEGRMIGTYADDADGPANYRRGFDNRLIKLVKDAALRNRVVQRLGEADRARVFEACFAAVNEALGEAGRTAEEQRLLEKAAAHDVEALEADARRFVSIYGDVPILPPDQYRALVVQATRGCPFNDCEFCSFYRGCAFHAQTAEEFAAHLDAVRAFFGESLRLRHSVFLGDANAVLLPTERLLERMQQVRERFNVAPPEWDAKAGAAWRRDHPYGLVGFYGFLDGLTGTRKAVEDYRRLRSAGLQRIYIGAESGCDAVLEALRKPSRREQVVETVTMCKAAGVGVGVILLAGLCEDDPAAAREHVEQSTRLIDALKLDRDDLVYLSPLVRGESDTPRLPPFVDSQLDEMEKRLSRERDGARIVPYDIRGFIY
jgi:radical SAM superfamily enzyme YgiQ (UPF0313 family)